MITFIYLRFFHSSVNTCNMSCYFIMADRTELESNLEDLNDGMEDIKSFEELEVAADVDKASMPLIVEYFCHVAIQNCAKRFM